MADFWVHGVIEPQLAQAHPDWRITDGLPGSDAAFQVLVAGRPTAELLDASPALHTLVVPFAGVPRATSELLADRPHLTVRTLHHTAAPTAELALGLVLSAARALIPADRAMRDGDWTPRFEPPRPTMILEDSNATVVGYGEVGRRVCRGLSALGMSVRAIRASATTVHFDETVQVHPLSSLPELLSDSRVLVLAVPGIPETDGLIGGVELDLLPRPAVLVNVARASVVDEAALYQRLARGDLAAGLDVWWTEATGDGPHTGIAASRYPFHELSNVVLSPHRGGAFSLPEMAAVRLRHLERLLTELVGKAVDS